VTDFLQLPSPVRIVVLVMLWPAIWAAALLIMALAGDLMRETKRHDASHVMGRA
jgi:hypothetical protein